MCRHLAWLGAPRALDDLLVSPPHSLYEQSWAPRQQQHGTINVDGFGAGWYVAGRATPVRYRRAQPVWTDASFASLAPTVTSRCVLGAVRSATPGTAADESAAAPFTHERWLFSHNGRLHDWSTARKALAPEAADVADARSAVDSALLFGLAVAAWQGGAGLAEGLVAAAEMAQRHGGGRLTMLAADGDRVAGVVLGEPLHLCESGGGVTIASEPHDDHPWRRLDGGSVVEAGPDGLTETRIRQGDA